MTTYRSGAAAEDTTLGQRKAATASYLPKHSEDMPMPWCEPCGCYHTAGNHLRRVSAERDTAARAMLAALRAIEGPLQSDRLPQDGGALASQVSAAIAAAEAAGITTED